MRPYKVPFVGDATVGKTALIARYSSRVFLSSPITTVGMSNIAMRLTFDDQVFRVNVWDTAGQERFRTLVPLYLRDSDLVVLVFSMASAESFRSLDFWFEHIRTDTKLRCPVIVVGNKVDLDPEISEADVKHWCQNHQCAPVFVSAKTNANVNNLFQFIAELLSSIASPKTSPAKEAVADPAPEKTKQCC